MYCKRCGNYENGLSRNELCESCKCHQGDVELPVRCSTCQQDCSKRHTENANKCWCEAWI